MGRMVNSSYWGRPKMTGPTSHVQVPASHVQRLAKRVPIGTLAMFVCQVRCGCVGQSVESLGVPGITSGVYTSRDHKTGRQVFGFQRT